MSDTETDDERLSDMTAAPSGFSKELKEAKTDRLDRRVAESLDIAEERVRSHDLEDDLAEEHARQLLKGDLEELYEGALDVNNPPESISAFEDRVALRRLVGTAVSFGAVAQRRATPAVFVESDAGDVTEIQTIEELLETHSTAHSPARAKKAIDRMVQFGEPAKQFLPMVSRHKDVHPEIAEYALDALGELQDADDEPASFWSGVRAALFGGGGQ